jgi:hypothetical protein
MQELGGLLRAERERQGRSLEEAYRATHITTRYLKSLEAGEFERIPGEVYLKGFLRRYGDFLGLDGEELVRRYREQRAASEAAARPERAPRTRPAERDSRGPQRSARLMLIIAAAVLAALASGWALAIWSLRLTGPEPPAPADEPPKAEAPPPYAPLTPPPEPVPAGPTAPPAPVRVSLEVTDRCWVRVVADGRLAFTGELAAGDRREWTAEDRLSVRFGNPGGVKVTWNGQPVALERGDPVTRLFTKQAVIRPPAPLPAPPDPSAPASPAATPAGEETGGPPTAASP